MTTPRPIRIFDTTLRDGEQSPGASMNLTEKMEIAQALVAPRRGHHRGRLPDRLAGRLRRASATSPAASSTAPRSAAWPAATTPTSTGPGRPCRPARAAADPRLPRHQLDPPRVQAADERGRGARPGRRRRDAGPRPLRRRRVLARGRRPHRDRLPLPRGRGGDRRRRDHGQHSRHRRLRHADADAPRDQQPPRTACPTSTRP